MISEPVLIDTGPLIAFYSEADFHHSVCKQQMASLPVGKVYTCWPVITEAAYMLRKHPKQRDDLLLSLANEELVLLQLRERDLKPVHEILSRYDDQEIDLADARLLHLAERESIKSVFTLDRRHFSVLKKRDGEPLRMLPES